MRDRHPFHCICPPFMLDRLAQSKTAAVRKFALASLAESAAARQRRVTLAALAPMSAIPSPEQKKHRLVYTAKQGTQLPGTLLRSEGGAVTKEPAANEAYNHAGTTYDYFAKNHQRNSLDGNGMSLISTVRYSAGFNNAFWDGEQMVYGDGDGIVFRRFTRSLEVVGHELAHGVVSFTCNLVYRNEAGALNEHFADVFGTLVNQWRKKQAVKKANWLIGDEIMVPAPTRRALRDMAAPGTAFHNDPELGDDPQPSHMSNKYKGQDDRGGVHINSGIPNFAFYTIAMTLGGNAWSKAGQIWYKTMLQLNPQSVFQDCATISHQVAGTLYGNGSIEQKAVEQGWKAVGISV